MPIYTDTPGVRPPTAEDMATRFAPPPSEDFASKPEYETAEEAYKAEGPGEEMQDFASKAMGTPSRYDSDLVKDITGQIDAELEQKKLYAGTELDEFMSKRGMVGSSVEGELRKSMLGDMERQRQERLNELNVRAADAWASDRAGAADIGFKSAEFQRALGGDREGAARYEAEFGQSQYEFDKEYGVEAWGTRIEERRLHLTAKGMDRDDAYRLAMSEVQTEQFAETLGEERAARVQRYGLDIEALENETRRIEGEERGLTIQEARDEAEVNLRLEQLQAQKEDSGEAFELDRERIRVQNEQFRDRLGLEQLQYEEQRAARIATIGLSARDLDQSAERLQLDALVQGRTMDLQEARGLAETEFRALELSKTMGLEQARLKAQDDQFRAQHSQNVAQWADSLGMERNQYEEAVAARHAEYEDRRGARLDQMGLQAGSLEHEAMQSSLSRTLEREALELQKSGLDEESAWRLADRIQQGRLEDKALDIQNNGISEEAAWRGALNESNERMQSVQLSSQRTLVDLGIGADVARDVTREAHEAAMNAANIASAEKVEELARALQESGIEAETAWRAATDASQKAMNNANNLARETLETSLLDKGIAGDMAAQVAAQISEAEIVSGQNHSQQFIQMMMRDTVGDQISSEESWRSAQRTHEQTLRGMDMTITREDLAIKKYATEEDLLLREWEFENSNNTERLRMAMVGLEGKLDTEKVKSWMSLYPATGMDSTEQSVAFTNLEQLLADAEAREKALAEWYAQSQTPGNKTTTGKPEGAPDAWVPGWYKEGGKWYDAAGNLVEAGRD
mgnify:CR=1 FL=1